jgi:hypothetical protein
MDQDQNQEDVSNDVIGSAIEILKADWLSSYEISFPFSDRVKKCYE